MRRVNVSTLMLSGAFALPAAMVGLVAGLAQAALLTTGDVNPVNSANWTNGSTVSIGTTSNGAVVLDSGSTVNLGSVTANLGNAAGVTGTISVDGAGSAWQGFGASRITAGNGAGGIGVINLTNGGLMSGLSLRVGFANNSTGILNISNGGILANGAALGDAVGSTGIATVDGAGSQLNNALAVGDRGTGLLTIKNGASATTYYGTVGRYSTGTGIVVVDGPGSSWNVGTSGLQVGIGIDGGGGVGRLTVTNGAVLAVDGSVQDSGLGIFNGSKGTVMVNGASSQWTNLHGVHVGQSGTGQLSLSDGAAFTASALTINSASVVTMDVGTGSTVTSTGALINDGTIRMAAKATAANGTYTPISAGSWSGSGQVQALGGVYDQTNHSVTVSTAATGQAGVATTIDRAVTQRMLITDSATGKLVGASFQAATAPSSLSLTAALMNPSQVSVLQGLLTPGQAVLGAWDFSATGYTTGDPVYLSLQVDGGQKFYDLNLWHYNGLSWDRYLNTDLAYDGTFASFVATSFSGYAVSGVAPVPVPAAVWLFGSGLAAIVEMRRRNKIKTPESQGIHF
ncbi:VPLPA-CTERM sorting domain-containing protein [Nitrospira lenta]|uniref:PEP-CTERM protein-sorting domain-containing protein n=1 Tax=Nitrospira lenta TaxID=1436998 RepID=A0A330L110_9BACT|nr:VPLPA-CTERM sorting domain-containing protein [Nitrospira lenta]SPP62949.1 exported hypothetical protein [Nitrospira lenta]